MDILFITPRLPYPPDQGSKIVMLNFIKFLSKRHKITLFSLAGEGEDPKHIDYLKQYCRRIEVVNMRPKWSVKNFLLALFRLDPYTSIKYYSPALMKKLKELFKKAKFDVIQVEFYYMAQYIMKLRRLIPESAVILDTLNVEYFMFGDYFKQVKNPVLKFFMFFELLRIKRYESLVYKCFDRCLAISKGDIDRIKSLAPGANIVLQPTGVDTDLCASYNIKPKDNTIIFYGAMSFFANYDGIKYFYDSIYPLIKKFLPSVKLIIAGGSPPAGIRALKKDPSVTVTGYVEDIKLLIAASSVVVVPLRVGGGVRLKIMEAWAMGKAVVSTSIGADGLEFSDGDDIIIADKPVDFAKKTVKLLKNEDLRRRLGKKARYKAQTQCAWDKNISSIEIEYKKAVEEKLKNGNKKR